MPGNASCEAFEVVEAVLSDVSLLTVVISVALVLLLIGLFVGRASGSSKAAALQRESIDKQLDLIRKSLDTQGGDGQLQFPLVIIRAQDFLNSRGLKPYEELRRGGTLIILDNLAQLKQFERKQRIVFFSHQWTSFTAPDPNNVQFDTMVAAMQHVQAAKKWPLERMFVWCDYTSVPQAHRPTMELAIKSLAVYSSRAHAFIAVVPTTTHSDTGEECNAETYKKRLWTRAECLTHLLVNGRDSMWVATGPKSDLCRKMPPEWLRGSALCIFSGESTCCLRKHAGMDHCDRELLVQPLLGLYGGLYAEAKERGLLVEPSMSYHAASHFGAKRRQSDESGSSSLDNFTLEELVTTKKPEAVHEQESEAPKGVFSLSGVAARRRSAMQGFFPGTKPAADPSAMLAEESQKRAKARMHEYELIAKYESEVFPRQFGFATDDHPDGVVVADLFGELVPLMKMIIDQDSQLRALLNQQRSRLHTRRRQFELRLANRNVTPAERKSQFVARELALSGGPTCEPCEEDGSAPAGMSSVFGRAFANGDIEAPECSRAVPHAPARRGSIGTASLDMLAGAGAEEDVDESFSFNTNAKSVMMDAKLRRRWSFSALHAVQLLDATSHHFQPPEACGGAVDDRLTLAASVAIMRRKAEWLDGEKEYAADSHRHQTSQRHGGACLASGAAPTAFRPRQDSKGIGGLKRQTTRTDLKLARTDLTDLGLRNEHRSSLEMTLDKDTLKSWKTLVRATTESRKTQNGCRQSLWTSGADSDDNTSFSFSTKKKRSPTSSLSRQSTALTLGGDGDAAGSFSKKRIFLPDRFSGGGARESGLPKGKKKARFRGFGLGRGSHSEAPVTEDSTIKRVSFGSGGGGGDADTRCFGSHDA